MTAAYATAYDPDEDFDAWYSDVTAEAIATQLAPGQTVLELGCATGRMSARFAAADVEVTGVDRSAAYLARAAARRLPRARWVNADVDAHLRGDRRRYDHVVATNLLHELDDPAAFVAAAAERLRPGGVLHLTLQNPSSIHRLVALDLGLIDDLRAISDRGRAYGTRRLLTRDELVALGTAAGLRWRVATGLCLKPLPNALMADLPPEVLDGFALAAHRLPEVAAMNYVVLTRG